MKLITFEGNAARSYEGMECPSNPTHPTITNPHKNQGKRSGRCENLGKTLAERATGVKWTPRGDLNLWDPPLGNRRLHRIYAGTIFSRGGYPSDRTTDDRPPSELGATLNPFSESESIYGPVLLMFVQLTEG